MDVINSGKILVFDGAMGTQLAEQAGNVSWGIYNLTDCPDSAEDLFSAVAARRGLLRPGGAVDLARAATVLLKDYRDGKLGRITLERVPVDGDSD